MSTPILDRPSTVLTGPSGMESSVSAASWPAIFAGAFAAAAISLILIVLGAGLGLASISPWRSAGASATAFTVTTAIWLVVVQWVASSVGGYLTGRLRTKWVGAHTHEVFFRDTAHGLVTWSVATAIVAVLLASAAASAVSTGVRAGATVASGMAGGASDGASASRSPTWSGATYEMDTLFRSPRAEPTAGLAEAKAEAARMLARGIATGDVSTTDRTYLTEVVATRTGLSKEEAERRVDAAIAQMKADDAKVRQAADVARKAGAEASVFTALAMVIGAFIAGVSAALGGRLRDEHL